MKSNWIGFRQALRSFSADSLTLSYVLLAIGWVILVEILVYAVGLPPAYRFVITTLRAFTLIGITAFLIFQLASQKDRHHGAKIDAIETRYKLLFDRNPVPMWIYEAKTYRFKLVNVAATVHYGYTENEFKRMTLWDIRPADEHEELRKHLYEVEYQEHFFKGVWRHRKKSGEIIHVEIDSLIIEYEGEPCRLVLATDVTKLVKSQEETKIIAEELSHFVYRASHDLRGPIARMMGLAMMLERDTVYTQEYIRSLLKTGKQMDEMLTRLMSINLLKKYQPAFEQVKLRDLVTDVITRLTSGDLHAIAIRNLVEENLAIHADPKIITLVLENLVDNAVKYRKDEIQSCIWIRAAQENGQVHIQVADNGIGIPEELRGKIFNIFFRGTERSEGSGLGLYIVQEALKCHHGSIRLGSAKEASTVFEVFIPLCA